MTEFDNWQSRFATSDYIFGTEPNDFLARQRHRLPPTGKALAVADGEGRNGVWLAEQGLDVLSIDFSPNALAKAQALAKARDVKIETETADVPAWNWPEATFDVVALIFCQFATPDQRSAIFAGIRKSLKGKGLLLLQGYRPEQIANSSGGPKQVERLYTRALLDAEFGSFAELTIREHDSVIAEGIWHNGVSALIDLVGVK